MAAQDEAAEFIGPDNGGWYYTTMRDWIAVCPEVSATAARLYWIIRSLMLEKGNRVRRLSIDQLCWLLPGINGKPTSETRVKDSLRELEAIGLLSNPEGNVVRRWVTNTDGTRTRENYRRWQVHDLPTNYEGPHSAFELLNAYPGPGWRESTNTKTESRKSDPQQDTSHSPAKTTKSAGHTESRKSAQTRRKSATAEPVSSDNEDLNKVPEEILGNQSIDARENNDPYNAGDGSMERCNEEATTEDAPASPQADEWALQLVTDLDYGRFRRPTRKQVQTLATLVTTARDEHGLTEREIRRHCRAVLNEATRSGVAYLQGALGPDRLPVPRTSADTPATTRETPTTDTADDYQDSVPRHDAEQLLAKGLKPALLPTRLKHGV